MEGGAVEGGAVELLLVHPRQTSKRTVQRCMLRARHCWAASEGRNRLTARRESNGRQVARANRDCLETGRIAAERQFHYGKAGEMVPSLSTLWVAIAGPVELLDNRLRDRRHFREGRTEMKIEKPFLWMILLSSVLVAVGITVLMLPSAENWPGRESAPSESATAKQPEAPSDSLSPSDAASTPAARPEKRRRASRIRVEVRPAAPPTGYLRFPVEVERAMMGEANQRGRGTPLGEPPLHPGPEAIPALEPLRLLQPPSRVP